MKSQINLIIVEDHTILRELLAESLIESMDAVISGHWQDAESALEHLAGHRVDIAIVDNHLPYPGMSGIEFTAKACAICPSLKVIILTMDTNERFVRKAFEAGASGYVLKTAPVDELRFAIRAVMRGQPYVSAEITRCILFEQDPIPKGTHNNHDINAEIIFMLEKARDGLGNKEIADLLGVHLSVVKTRFSRLMKRLNAKDRTETVVIAMKKGIIGMR
jgi:DNA-binding NarL/FixJ family response regulator